MENRAEMAGGVCVFAPSTIVTVTVESADGGDEVHFHAGGQGFWIARLLGRLGVQTSLVTPLGGEAGRVVRALIEAEAIELRAVETSTATGTWVHDRRSGERSTIAEHEAQALDRHATDELYGAALAAALNAGICVLAGPHRPDQISGAMYRRLCGDLRANEVTLIADLSGPCLRGALEAGVDFCKASDEDLAKTEGFGPDGPSLAHLEQLVAAGASNAALTVARRRRWRRSMAAWWRSSHPGSPLSTTVAQGTRSLRWSRHAGSGAWTGPKRSVGGRLQAR